MRSRHVWAFRKAGKPKPTDDTANLSSNLSSHIGCVLCVYRRRSRLVRSCAHACMQPAPSQRSPSMGLQPAKTPDATSVACCRSSCSLQWSRPAKCPAWPSGLITGLSVATIAARDDVTDGGTGSLARSRVGAAILGTLRVSCPSHVRVWATS